MRLLESPAAIYVRLNAHALRTLATTLVSLLGVVAQIDVGRGGTAPLEHRVILDQLSPDSIREADSSSAPGDHPMAVALGGARTVGKSARRPPAARSDVVYKSARS
jgi:hypothetical protein